MRFSGLESYDSCAAAWKDTQKGAMTCRKLYRKRLRGLLQEPVSIPARVWNYI